MCKLTRTHTEAEDSSDSSEEDAIEEEETTPVVTEKPESVINMASDLISHSAPAAWKPACSKALATS